MRLALLGLSDLLVEQVMDVGIAYLLLIAAMAFGVAAIARDGRKAALRRAHSREPVMNPGGKVYLGDGVYAQMDDLQLVLTTENGIEVTNRIILEPEVLDNMNQYLKAWFVSRHAKAEDH